MSKQVMQAALDVIAQVDSELRAAWDAKTLPACAISTASIDGMASATEALRAALDAPVEPVAWTVTEMDSVITNDDKQTNAIQFSQRYLDMHDIPLYLAPPDAEGVREELERVKGERDALLIACKRALNYAENVGKAEGVLFDNDGDIPAIEAAIAAQGGKV